MNTILFDLDGTLLPIDMEQFLSQYFDRLSKKCAHIAEEKLFKKALWQSTEYMIKNKESHKTNENAFMEDFCPRIQKNFDEISPVLEEFYQREFKTLKNTTQKLEPMKKMVHSLKEKGYTLVVATNPLFPRQAILHRIHWAGLHPEDFDFITDYETMHYCKPHIEFYDEIISKIHKDPEECLMVGNDVQEDLVAARLGMKTFLVEDNIINRSNMEIISDYRGTYQELFQFVEALPNLHEHNDKDVI
ncbi:HAD family hydrolase [Anaerosolibacter sp.]|uniref:HAD family hydrolase n=1 Tax=Anaerosolibacter sp. TaxID=1872527 RepID=UPI0039F04A5F